MNPPGNPLLSPVGDQAVSLAFGDGDDPLACLRLLDEARPSGVADVVPGHSSLLIIYDPGRLSLADLERWVRARLVAPVTKGAATERRVEIPVFYDPSVAPDLLSLAAEKSLAVSQLVAMHSAASYRCQFLGFRPGFPFLSGLDARLATPRLPSPRVRVPAGSVGIGGTQAGVYPVDSPGGWRIIGRTPLRLFDPARADPFFVHPGDRVTFAPIDAGTYLALAAAA